MWAGGAPPSGDDEQGGDERRRPSQSTLLVALAREHYMFISGDDGRAYAMAKAGPRIALPLRDGFRVRLARHHTERYGSAPRAGSLADALTVLEGYAADAAHLRVFLRVAAHDSGVVLDLGTPDGRCVVVNAAGWAREDRSPVVFRRNRLIDPMPDPVRAGTLHELRELFNVSEPQWHLLVGWLLAAFLPDMPHPVLAIFGEQGTAKSMATRTLLELIDPSPAPLRSQPRDLAQWAVTASNSWTVGLDNISSIPPWLSDALCKAVTGDGHVGRALYTDDGLSILKFRRVIALNGIAVASLRGDLAQRIVPLELDRIADTARRTEEDVRAVAAAVRPSALGALLDLLSRVLSVLPSVRLASMPRMADFARVLAALDRVTGWETLKTYDGAAGDLAATVADSDPVATALCAFIDGRRSWTGSPEELRRVLPVPDPRPRHWPQTAQAMAGALKRLSPALRSLGYTVDRSDHADAVTRRHPWRLAAPSGQRT